MLLTAIQGQTAIYKLRVTRFTERSLMQQLTQQLASNTKAQQAKKKTVSKKKVTK